jgi:Initiator Replication protein.
MRGDDKEAKIFQLLNWEIFNSFNGKYEAILYKLCKDYKGIGRTPYMTIDEYREYIGLKDGEYSVFKKLNVSTVTKPLKAINENELSDIEVSVKYIRSERKTDGLYFIVKEKKQASLPFIEFEPNPAFALAKVFISIENQTKYLEEMPTEEIEATIKRANEYGESIKTKGQKVQMGAIYNKAFAERWGIQYLSQQKAEQAEAQKELDKSKQKKEQATIKAEAEKQVRELKEKRFLDFEALPEDKKKEIIGYCIEQADSFNKPKVQTAYERYGTNAHRENKIFSMVFSNFLEKNN